MEYKFDFVVDGLTDTQIEKFWDLMIAFVEACGGTIGGGSHLYQEAEDEQKQQL